MTAASTRQRVLRSSIAAYGSQLGRTAIRIVAELTLARLVLPERHGLFEEATAVVVILALVRDLGLPYHLVREPRQAYGTVFAWITGASLVLAGGVFAAAPIFAAWAPGLPEVLRVFALWIVLDGLSVVPRVFFERRLEVGRLVLPELLRGLAFAVLSIALAATGHGVWSFVAGELVAAALFAGLVWWRARGALELDLAPGILRDLLAKSRYLFLIALAAVSLPWVAVLILGSFVHPDVVAYFTKARTWAFRLQILVLPAVARVLYPTLVEYERHPRRFFAAYRLGTLSILCLETLAAYFLFFNAKVVLVDVLLGPKWQGAVPLIQLLCFAPLVDPMSRLGGEVLKARQEDRVWLLVVVLNSISLFGFGWALTASLGAEGMAWANYLLLGNLLMTWSIWRALGKDFWLLVRDLIFVYLVPLPFFLLTAWALPAESWSRFAGSWVAAAVAGGLYLLRFHRPFRAFFLETEAAEEEGSPESIA
ncbi:MAG: oligosaccharide flippase family protein [Acidobacteria bacterium]|nr:oligosaccharide flippase family protein [Acidobacteriota bacterium]